MNKQTGSTKLCHTCGEKKAFCAEQTMAHPRCTRGGKVTCGITPLFVPHTTQECCI